MKTVLVTGAHGFLGRYCASQFHQQGWQVIGAGRGQWKDESHEKFGIEEWHECNVDLDALRSLPYQFDSIVHCAGSGSVSYSYSNPVEDFQNSVATTLAVLEYMRLICSTSKLICISSAAVYGCKDEGPIQEGEPLSPVSPYGTNKKIAEELCDSYSRTFGLDVGIIRLFSVYGVGLKKQLLWDACNRISKARGRVEFFGTGEETRDWIHVQDAADLVYRINHSVAGLQIINGAVGMGVTVRDVLNMVASVFGNEVEISFNGQAREGDPRHYHADITRALATGWRPSVDLASGIKEYVAWYKGGG